MWLLNMRIAHSTGLIHKPGDDKLLTDPAISRHFQAFAKAMNAQIVEPAEFEKLPCSIDAKAMTGLTVNDLAQLKPKPR